MLINNEYRIHISSITYFTFPPQIEVTRAGGYPDMALVVNLFNGPAYMQADPNGVDFAVGLQDFELAGADANYRHPHVVTACDVVTALRADANDWPMIRVGRWSNAAEILTGLGMCMVETPSASTLRIGSHLESLRSVLLKGRELRAYIEVMKVGALIGDAAAGVGDVALNIDEAKWQMEVGGEGATLRSIAEQTMSGGHSSLRVLLQSQRQPR
ncbi:hypothetical protein M8J77_014994 [Diaphorina citri]|nr:hypothetical protein M8J77_014994 [Diaphorina citri]